MDCMTRSVRATSSCLKESIIMVARRSAMALGFMIGLCPCVASWAGEPGKQVATLTELRDADIDAMLTAEARRLVQVLPRIKGQRKKGVPVSVEAWMDLRTGRITVNFDTGYLPEIGLGDWEDLADNFSATLEHLVKDVMEPTGARFLFDGKGIRHYIPDTPIPEGLRSKGRASGFVGVSAGHGAYYDYGDRSWKYQRDVRNGITEDEVTPLLADSLRILIEERSRQPVHMLRSTLELLHEASGKSWWMVAARYALQEKYPTIPAIWNSMPGSARDDRERLEDIRSRPLLANHEGVDVLLSVHTDASEVPTARGTRVYVYEGRPQDYTLAGLALCYMKEIITAQVGYGDFPVSEAPRYGDHGENRIAVMPAIIVETAFHTNAQDAVALQDPVFREAAMKGVEKGWRLFSQGVSCTPLKTLSVPAVSMPQQSERKAEIKWEGYPQYPLRIETRNVGCPPRWTCTDGLRVINAPSDEPLQLRLACNGNGSAPVHWATRLVDADGVATKEVRHTQQCIRKPGSSVPDPGAGVQVRTDIVSSDDVPASAMYR